MERTLSQLLPGANKVVHSGCGPRPLFAGLIQRRWAPWSKPKHGFDNYHNKDNYTIQRIISKSLGSNSIDYLMLCRHIEMMLPLNLNLQLNATSALWANDSTLDNVTDTYSEI